MKEYRYFGPASDVTLSDETEVLLWSGKTVFLPEEHDYVKVLVVLEHLTPEPEDTEPTITPTVQSPKRRSDNDGEVKTEDAHGS